MLAPVAYIILGGFRSNSEITVDPSGLPTVWNWQNYVEVLVEPRLLDASGQLDDRRGRDDRAGGRAGTHGRIRALSLLVPRARV